MAPPTANIDLTDQLVATLLPKGLSAAKLRKCKDVFSKRLKSHSCARTSQFEVESRYDVLQEKFQILNNDELADAIHCRLLELQHITEKWMPDILDLFLRLADDPINKTRIEWLSHLQNIPAEVPKLTWAEIEADDPIDRNDQTWKSAEYSDLSSDEDIISLLPETSPYQTANHTDKEHSTFPWKLESSESDSHLETLHFLAADQFWQNFSSELLELDELQVIREVLFTLQGCPTTLFQPLADRFEADDRVRLRGISRESFLDITHGFTETVIYVERIRKFTKKKQSEKCLQTLQSTLERFLQEMDAQLRLLEQKLLMADADAPATILQLSASVGSITPAVGSLAKFVEAIEPRSTDTVYLLESLFEHVCRAQLSHDEAGFQCLLHSFVRCFQTYFEPLQEWMERGVLNGSRETFVVEFSRHERSLSGLWQSWYGIGCHSATNLCPQFLQSVHVQILNIGKTVVFFRHLDEVCEDATASTRLALDKLTQSGSNTLLPFAEDFQSSLQEAVHQQLQMATSTLRDFLGSRCGLWDSLEALSNIYLGKNGTLNEMMDMRIFAAIDRCDKNWRDRFVLGDLLQATFESIRSVDVPQLSIRSSPRESKNIASQRKSVKMLNEVRINYALHWSVANVITKASMGTYQRISTFLLQIRRARYMLERRSSFSVRSRRPRLDARNTKLSQLIHHDLLFVITNLYDHLTSLVIGGANIRLRQNLENAVDIDAMITAHTNYCQELEAASLTSACTKATRDHIMSILDICIALSDLLLITSSSYTINDKTTHAKPNFPSSEKTGTPSSFSVPRPHRRHNHPRLPRRTVSETTYNSSDDDDDDDDDDDEATNKQNSLAHYPSITQEDDHQTSSFFEQLLGLRAEFHRHLDSIIVELLCMSQMGQGREGQQQQQQKQGWSSWEMLARRLRWDL